MQKFFKKTVLATAVATLSVSAFAASVNVNTTAYPALPEVIAGSGTGALVGDTLYVGLGSKSDLFYALDLSKPNGKWQEIPAFPGGARNQAAAAGVNGKLYVFGGFHNTAKADNQTALDAYEYDPATKKWTKLVTRSPYGPTAGTTAVTYKGKIYFFGGVNQNIWDGLFQDAKATGENKGKVFDKYFAMSKEDFFFNPMIASYDPATNHWANVGYFPYGGRAGALVAIKNGKMLVVNGELKAGVRSPQTAIGEFEKDGMDWDRLGDLPNPKKGELQEGIAAGVGGYSNGVYLAAGGANFPGVRANYAKGIYDHRAAKAAKTFRTEIYALNGKKWTLVGQLPEGIAGAVSVSYKGKVIVAGGSTTGNKPLTTVETLTYKK